LRRVCENAGKQNPHIDFNERIQLYHHLQNWLAICIHNHLFKGDAS